MQFIKRGFQKLWFFWFFFWFGFIFVMMYPLFYFLLSNRKFYPYANHLRRIWAKWLLSISGLVWKIEYEQPLNKKTYIFCPNHSSYLDIPLFAIAYPHYFHFMAKAELMKIPLFGIFFRTIDIAVDRKNKISAFNALKQAEKNLDNGENLVIFPEGSISKIAPRILKFKNGPFVLAINKQIPIVPVTFLDNWHRLPDNGTMLGSPGVARAIFHKPIETTGYTDADVEKLKEEVYKILEGTLKMNYESRFTISQ